MNTKASNKKINKIVLILLACTFLSFQKSNDNVNQYFKSCLLGEGIVELRNIKDNKRIYNADILYLETEEIGHYEGYLTFHRYKIGENRISVTDKNVKLGLVTSSCYEYIIAHDIESNKSFRLKGFNSNDLFFLIESINKHSYEGKRSAKKILKDLNEYVDIDIDFIKLFEAIKKMKFDSEYLIKCIDGKPAHGRTQE